MHREDEGGGGGRQKKKKGGYKTRTYVHDGDVQSPRPGPLKVPWKGGAFLWLGGWVVGGSPPAPGLILQQFRNRNEVRQAFFFHRPSSKIISGFSRSLFLWGRPVRFHLPGPVGLAALPVLGPPPLLLLLLVSQSNPGVPTPLPATGLTKGVEDADSVAVAAAVPLAPPVAGIFSANRTSPTRFKNAQMLALSSALPDPPRSRSMSETASG